MNAISDGTPRITSKGPDGDNMLVNETMEVTCSIACQGNMLPQIKWTFDSSMLYSCPCSIYNTSRSTSSLTQNTLYITYTNIPYYSQQSSFSCLIFFDRVIAADSVHATNAPSYTPVQLDYTVNLQGKGIEKKTP